MNFKRMPSVVSALFVGVSFLTSIQCQSRTETVTYVQKGNLSMKVFKKEISGNFVLNLDVKTKGKGENCRVFFSSNRDLSNLAFVNIFDDKFEVGRKIGDKTTIWKTTNGVNGPPWKIKILKKGNFFRFCVNEVTGWIRGPSGEWEQRYDPWQAWVGLETEKEAEIESFTITTLPWLGQINEPAIPKGPDGSFYEEQIIPGALLEYEDYYYMYCMVGMKGDEEGSSRRSIAVAISTDLKEWRVHPEPVISYEDYPYDNLYVNGATISPDGKVAVMFSAQVYPEWKGFMLATADNPLGPFEPYTNNPVYKHFTHAHEFDLVQVEHPDYRYILFYAGFTPNPPKGPVGDRGYMLFSNDLIHWTEHKQNPVFSPQTLNDWDAAHIRPRSLNKIGDTWYLWYEGCNHWMPPSGSHHGWWDTVGLARSKDLVNWEHYPRNPALPGLGVGPEQFDNKWVGWPRMFVKDGTGYVFYTGGSRDTEGGVHVGLRTISIEELTNWESEGGEIIDMLE